MTPRVCNCCTTGLSEVVVVVVGDSREDEVNGDVGRRGLVDLNSVLLSYY